jgi:hypothetical protein
LCTKGTLRTTVKEFKMEKTKMAEAILIAKNNLWNAANFF